MLVDNGADLAFRVGDEANTALHAAAIADNPELILFLLKRGMPIDPTNSYGNTPFFEAVDRGSEKAALLLSNEGADIHREGVASGEYRPSGEPALFTAVWHGYYDLVEMMIKNGANLTKTAKNGEPALAFAVRRGHVSVAKLLIENGADPAWKHDETSITLLHLATIGRSVAMLRLVWASWKETDLDSIAYVKPTYLPAHRSFRELENKFQLHNPWEQVHWTALQLATAFEDPEMVEVLLELKANVNARANDMTALLTAASNGVDVPAVNCLLNGGAHVDDRDRLGRTALHRASSEGDVNIITVLLEHKADIDARDLLGWTALHHAVSSNEVQAVHVLLYRWAADPNAMTNYGETPLHIMSSSWRPHMPAEPFSVVRATVSLLLQARGSVNAITEQELTLLNQCVWGGDWAMALVFLDSQGNVDVNAADSIRSTPLHWAVEGNCSKLRVKVAEWLLKAGANVTARCNKGYTPLYEASRARDGDMCLLLLRWGADAFSMVETGAANEQHPRPDQLRNALKFYLDSLKPSCNAGDDTEQAITGSGTGPSAGEYSRGEGSGCDISDVDSDILPLPLLHRTLPERMLLHSVYRTAEALRPSARAVDIDLDSLEYLY